MLLSSPLLLLPILMILLVVLSVLPDQGWPCPGLENSCCDLSASGISSQEPQRSTFVFRLLKLDGYNAPPDMS